MDGLDRAVFAVGFRRLQREAHRVAEEHGFHENRDNPLATPTALGLIMREASEALESHRKGQTDKVAEELADVVLRTADLAETLGIDLASAITAKHQTNEGRPYRHGGKLY